MKRIIVLLFLSASMLWGAQINKTIDELLNNETEHEVTLPKYDPFKRSKPLLQRKKSGKSVYRPRPAQLNAVMNDKAYINGRWYQVGDSISEGKLVKINRTSVYLKKGTTIKILPLKTNKNLVKISQKGGE